jgi:uncharacterized short protein YbdD (DUF466 family)
MNPHRDSAAVLPEAPGRPLPAAGEDGLRVRLRGFCSACRQVLGLPDYDRYLAHAAQRHPGAPVLSRAAFCEREIERKYGGRGGMRCC